MRNYKTLYLTEPNVPRQAQQGIADWVRQGGTLVTVSNASTRDRYDEDCDALAKAIGIPFARRDRILVPNAKTLRNITHGDTPVGTLNAAETLNAVGVRDNIGVPDNLVVAKFNDGSPAIIRKTVGQGTAFHFPWLPGISYWKSATATSGGLPTGFSTAIRESIVRPTQISGVAPPVSVNKPLVEAPLLLSPKGAAVTLLNWTGKPIDSLEVRIRIPFQVKTVESVRFGQLDFHRHGNSITLNTPLHAADILMLTPNP